jgi:hypothetical protein
VAEEPAAYDQRGGTLAVVAVEDVLDHAEATVGRVDAEAVAVAEQVADVGHDPPFCRGEHGTFG